MPLTNWPDDLGGSLWELNDIMKVKLLGHCLTRGRYLVCLPLLFLGYNVSTKAILREEALDLDLAGFPRSLNHLGIQTEFLKLATNSVSSVTRLNLQ